MGLPIRFFISGVNENDAVFQLLENGHLKSGVPVIVTNSPAMDIQVPYNLERLFYLYSGGNSKQIKSWFCDDMKQGGPGIDLKKNEIGKKVWKDFKNEFRGCVKLTNPFSLKPNFPLEKSQSYDIKEVTLDKHTIENHVNKLLKKCDKLNKCLTLNIQMTLNSYLHLETQSYLEVFACLQYVYIVKSPKAQPILKLKEPYKNILEDRIFHSNKIHMRFYTRSSKKNESMVPSTNRFENIDIKTSIDKEEN